MQIEILCRPASAAAKLTLGRDESVTCECGAMIAMSAGMTVETSTQSKGGGGGFFRGVKRLFSGESLFLNHFTAQQADQHLVIAPTLAGDILHHRLTTGNLVVQGGSWLASGPGIEVDTTYQGLMSGFLSGEGMFWVKLSGSGDVLLNSFGAIYPVQVDGGYTVDTGHIVAFEDTLRFEVGKANPSLIGSFLGGEGLVCKFQGRGTLWVQSHNPPSFGTELGAELKPR